MVLIEFPEGFIALIFSCLSTILYTVMVNGEQHSLFQLECGVRQGDPLFPYIFLLCSEGLAFLLKWATKNNLSHGLSVSYHGPQVSHLFFVYDSLLFYHATLSNYQVICGILRKYELVSG